MDRGEQRAILRRMLTADQSAMVQDAEMNAVINHGRTELAKKLGGVVTSATLSTDADGFADLPSDIIQIDRMEYAGARMGRISYDQIRELEDTEGTGSLASTASTGTYWFPYGRTKVGTYKQVVSDSTNLTLHYEQAPTALGLTNASDADLGIPADWEQALIDFVMWRISERVSKGDRNIAAYHRDQYHGFTREALAVADRHNGHRAFPRIMDF